MSEADRLFRELGCEKEVIDVFINYINKHNGKEISFITTNKEVCASTGYEFATMTMQELKAINKKCEELRMDMKREWKEIKGYEGKYIISNYGEIISLPRYKQNNSKLQYVEPKEIKRYVNPKNGYVYVQLWNEANYKNIRLHILVAQAFIPNKENKPQVNHIDGNKENNKTSNLEWATASENIRHAYENGLMGKERANAKN